MNTQVSPDLKLLLASQTQSRSLEACWMEGYAIAQIDGDYELNPFTVKSSEARFWEEGYMAGLYNELPLFPDYAVEVNLHHEPIKQAHNEALPTWKKILQSGRFITLSATVAVAGVAIFTTDLLELAAA